MIINILDGQKSHRKEFKEHALIKSIAEEILAGQLIQEEFELFYHYS